MRLERFIPTCVGNMDAHVQPRDRPAVHPHVCGEHGCCSCIHDCHNGSSPRVWGTCWPPRRHQHLSRFIPTCVGNITLIIPSAATRAVHPHVCGEHVAGRCARDHDVGSSPRVWGTCYRTDPACLVSRFIPTCVGNMSSSLPSVPFSSVHPHVCGEHHAHPGPGQSGRGSSPRVWGTFPALSR